MKTNINKILTNLQTEKIIKTTLLNQDQQKFWNSLSQKQIIQISSSILSYEKDSLHNLDKYSLIQLNYIFKVFSIEAINKKIKSYINKLDMFYIYNIIDYRIYYTNLKLIKKIKEYKKLRKKQAQKKDNNNGK